MLLLRILNFTLFCVVLLLGLHLVLLVLLLTFRRYSICLVLFLIFGNLFGLYLIPIIIFFNLFRFFNILLVCESWSLSLRKLESKCINRCVCFVYTSEVCKTLFLTSFRLSLSTFILLCLLFWLLNLSLRRLLNLLGRINTKNLLREFFRLLVWVLTFT